MIINSLTLENFKSHKNTKLNFDDNISLILGNNGAGKSTILEAISYSLFKEVDGTLDNQMRKTSEEEDIVKQMSVTIEFEHDGTKYWLKRGRKGKQSFAELRYLENNQYVFKCKGDKLVTKDIENILELDLKSFMNAVYIKQGEITDLIDKKSAEKKELISKLLNIDSFEKAWNEIRELQKVYENKIEHNEGVLENKENIENDNKDIQFKIDENKKSYENLKIESEELEKIVQKEETEVSKLQSDKTKYESLNDKKNIITEILEKSNKDKDENENKLKTIEANEKTISILEKETQKLPHLEELNEIKSEMDKNTEQINNLNKEISEINKNTKIKEDTQKAHDNIETINKELKELKDNKERITNEYLNYKSIETQITEKNRKLSNIKEDLQKASQNATELFNEYFNSPESIEAKIIIEKEKTENEIEQLRKTGHETEKEISVLENNLKNTEKSLNDLKLTEDICPICQSEISHEKHEELSNKYNEEISKYSTEINNLNIVKQENGQKLIEKNNFLNKINEISVELLKEKNDEFNILNNEIKGLKQKIPEDYDGQKLLDEVKSIINEKEGILKELQEKDKKYFLAVNRLKELSTPEEINKEIDELNNILREKKNKCIEIIRKYAVGDNLTLQIKDLKMKEKRLHTLQGQVQDKESVTNKINELNNEIINYNENLKEIELEIKNIDYDEEEYKRVNDTYAQNKDKLGEKEKKLVQTETEIKKDEENLMKNNQKLKELEDIALEQNNLVDYYNLLEKIRDIYSKDGVQKDLRDNVRPLIEKETSDIFNEFDFDYSGIKLDEDYNITIYNKNEELDSKMISGGEKIVIALSLRLGIAKVLSENKTDLLILDEPTIHLDEERRKSLIEIIREIKSVPQMIVVSHDEEMESLSNNIIKIVKHNGISSIDDS